MLSKVGRKQNKEKERKTERNKTEMRDILNCAKEMQCDIKNKASSLKELWNLQQYVGM